MPPAIMSDFFRASIDAAQSGGTPPPAPLELASALLPVSLASIVIYFAYEVVLLTWHGTTPGRRLVGISVRLRERPGPPPLPAVLRRTFVKEAGSIVGLLPVVGILGSLFTILDSLWPLWDERRQALHDKAGAHQRRPRPATAPPQLSAATAERRTAERRATMEPRARRHGQAPRRGRAPRRDVTRSTGPSDRTGVRVLMVSWSTAMGQSARTPSVGGWPRSAAWPPP